MTSPLYTSHHEDWSRVVPNDPFAPGVCVLDGELLQMTLHVLYAGSREAEEWKDVLPGDAIISPGTVGHWLHDVDKKPIVFMQRPLLVLSRFDGDMPWETAIKDSTVTSFVVLSRHGLFYVIKRQRK